MGVDKSSGWWVRLSIEGYGCGLLRGCIGWYVFSFMNLELREKMAEFFFPSCLLFMNEPWTSHALCFSVLQA